MRLEGWESEDLLFDFDEAMSFIPLTDVDLRACTYLNLTNYLGRVCKVQNLGRGEAFGRQFMDET
jgi:hypothetical protein